MPAPERQTKGGNNGGGRPASAAGLVVGYLGGLRAGITRGDLCKHFGKSPSRTTVYRVVDDLLAEERVTEAGGLIALTDKGRRP